MTSRRRIQFLKRCCGQVGKCGDELGRAIQRFGTPKLHSQFLAVLLEENIDVIKYFDVVAYETNRLHEKAGVSCRLQGCDGVLNCGPDPWASGHSLTLEGEVPFVILQSALPRNQFGGVLCL